MVTESRIILKILVFSDSHGVTLNMKSAIDEHLRYGGVDCVFFLGDGLSDFEELIYDRSRAYIAVRGNWDVNGFLGDSMVKKTDSITLLGHRIFLTHGDLYGVKYGLDGIKKLAVDHNADIVLFGHTHRAYLSTLPEGTVLPYIGKTDRRLMLFNPGSIGSGPEYTYGVITVIDGQVLAAHGRVV